MGIWSYQVLANDVAADHFDSIIEQLLTEAQAIIDSPEKLAEDLSGQGHFIPNIAMLVALSRGMDHCLLYDADEVKEYRGWRMRYLDAFEKTKKSWSASEYYWPRYVVIDQLMCQFNGCIEDSDGD